MGGVVGTGGVQGGQFGPVEQSRDKLTEVFTPRLTCETCLDALGTSSSYT